MNNSMRVPKIDFLIIGAAKCATTSFHHYLNQHPEIYLPLHHGINHETGYFLIPGDEQIKGLTNDMIRKDVNLVFNNYQGESLVGERSTDYTKSPFRTVDFEKINSHNSRMKFLFFVREPITKLKKLYFHHLKNRPEQTESSFEKELEKANGYYEKVSSHYYQVQFYYNQFDPQNIRVINIEKFDEHPREIMSKIFRFLDVSDYLINTKLKYNINVLNKKSAEDRLEIPPALEERLKEDFSRLIELARVSKNYIA
jgi:hypothetical protein